MKAIAILISLAMILSLEGCKVASSFDSAISRIIYGNPQTVAGFIEADKAGVKIDCADLLASSQVEDDGEPFILAVKPEQYTFKQCQKEINADSASRCIKYAQELRAHVSHQAEMPIYLERGRLPNDWANLCSTEIHARLQGWNEHYQILPGRVVSLDDQGVRFRASDVSHVELSDAAPMIGIWLLTFDKYQLWFTDETAANHAYDDFTKLIAQQPSQGGVLPTASTPMHDSTNMRSASLKE